MQNGSMNEEVGALLEEVEQLNTQALEDFVAKVLSIRAERVASVLPEQEAQLIQQINIGLSPEHQLQFEALVKKRQDETITSEELQDLMTLTEEAERLNVERMKCMGKLAHLRNVPLRELMHQLGVLPV